MKVFDGRKRQHVEIPPAGPIAALTKGANGEIVIRLSGPEHKDSIEVFLRGVRTDFQFSKDIDCPFEYEFVESNNSFIVKLVGATKDQVLDYFRVNELLVPRDTRRNVI